MTAPERIWVYSTDGAYNGDCDVAQVEFHDSHSYTRTDIHQAALDRIAVLEAALGMVADYSDACADTEGRVKLHELSTWRDLARAVLAKGDDDENPMCDDCGSRIGREGCKCPVAKGDG